MQENQTPEQTAKQDLENFNGTIHYSDVSAFRMVRAPSDPKLFVVVAVDKEENVLYTTGTEVNFETAANDVEVLSKDIVILQEIEEFKFL